MRQHPVHGWAHLRTFAELPALAQTVCRQHHERLDGSGYPDGLAGSQIHPISKICAVVDSFDAMTALRPFKSRSLSTSDAILELKAGVPDKYDAAVVDTWVRLLGPVTDREASLGSAVPGSGAATDAHAHTEATDRRHNKRFRCHCPARVHTLRRTTEGGLHEEPAVQVQLHSISTSGMGLLSPQPFELGAPLRIYLLARTWTGRFVHGQTVRCRAYRDGWFEVGVELFPDDAEPFSD